MTKIDSFEHKIEVKGYMMRPATPDFDFMKKMNDDIPMPLKIMYGTKLDETRGMVKMKLHGDIKQKINRVCMMCGRPIDNPISQYFGVGPICGGHNYVNPFNSEEELNDAIAKYRKKLVNTTWTGWIIKSAIESIDDNCDIQSMIDNMPTEVVDDFTSQASEQSKSEQPSPIFEIHAIVGTPIKCTDDYSVFLTFNYNKQVVDAIKNLRARFWDPSDKVWEIEYKELAELQSALPEYKFDLQNTEVLPNKITLPADYSFKTSPMKHQIEGIEYGLDHSRWLLADDQGLGKTKEIIDLALIRKQTQGFKHCLIVCGVNGLKWNWVEEIQKHTMFESGYILGQIRRKRSGKVVIGSTADKISDLDKLLKGDDTEFPYFLITNIESLRNAEIATKLKELCDAEIINMVAVDEIHRVKNLKTQQGTGLMQVQPYYRIGMTGTPLMNSPLDLFAIMKWLGYEPYEFGQFKYHFCNVDAWGNIIGYKNIDQLREQLSAFMLRRTKAEVLDLPAKIYTAEYVDMTKEQVSLYNRAIADAVNTPDDPDSENECILATLLKLRQISGGIGPYCNIKKNPKLDRLEQIVEEAVYSGTKVIVYSNWIQGIAPAIERLAKYNPVVITGETKDADRQSIVDRFQNDDSVKVILGTVGALGTGLTLTAATEVVFLDEPWTNAAKEQACDRAHRIGTKATVNIHTIMAHDTYDEDVHSIVLNKKSLADTIVNKRDLLKLKIS